jgi:hypothetical protein
VIAAQRRESQDALLTTRFLAFLAHDLMGIFCLAAAYMDSEALTGDGGFAFKLLNTHQVFLARPRPAVLT